MPRKARHSIADPASDKVFYILNTIIMVFILLITIYPIWFVIIASVSDYHAVGRGDVFFLPVKFYIDAYVKLMQRPSILIGYRNTLFYTIAGTAINLLLTLTGGYALSIKFPGNRLISLMVTFTMFFGGGIVPTYFIYKNIGILNTIWVMLLPGAISAWNLILCRTFISQNIPYELYEAAAIDGCDRIKYYLKIVLPLSTVLVSMMTLFYAVGHWNSYFNAMMYLDKAKLYPLQLFAREILVENAVPDTDYVDLEALEHSQQIREQLKYALIVVASLPILALYPFLQKYFVKGIMVGSVKG